ncbi:hypothetical protein EVA_20583 [gut metagenome]|uniref:TerB family tellurite resistance protein n=1 Tax=gut metagenome TaxID=749906 RepID=J9FNY6_9ZZZZ
MKVDFNRTFKDYRGEDLVSGGRIQLMSDIIAQCLFNGEGVRSSGDPVKDGERKMRAYALCLRLVQAEGEVSISAEDAVLIKEAVTGLTPGCYAQVVKLIDE